MSTFAELSSPKALVTHREFRSESGADMIWSVLLADGYLVDCGTRGTGERRAIVLAEMVNSSGPERLSRSALKATQGETPQ